MTTEETTTAVEDENLNDQEAGVESQETITPKLYTEEEVEEMKKRMQSDTEKGVQKLIKKTQIQERAFKEIAKVAEDNSHLVNLYYENPDVAKIILDTYYDGQSIDQYKESIGFEEDLSNPETFNRKLEAELSKRERNKTISDKKEEFVKRLEMTDDERKKFEEAFSERMELKSFKLDDIETHLAKAYREVNDTSEATKKLKEQEVIAKTMAIGEGKSTGQTKKTKLDQARDDARDFLTTFNLN